MSLDKNQIAKIFTDKKLKGISNKQLAKDVGLNPATISRWFNFKLNLSVEKENEIVNYINNAKRYDYIRVEVN